MAIYRIQSGLIFDDGMDTLDSRWVVSPSTSYSIEDGGIKVLHNDTGETNVMFEVPDEPELLFEVKADYTPQRGGDEGGLVVWKSAAERLEFLESVDTTRDSEYGRWRVVKKNNLWTFFAFRGGSWELIDSSVCIRPVLMGAILKGFPDEGNVPMLLDRTILCKGSAITVANVNSGYEVVLVNAEGEVVNRQIVPEGYSGVTMELPSIPFYGKIEVRDTRAGNQEGEILHEMKEPETFYGGDMFLIGTELLVKWGNRELDSFNPTQLGALKNERIEEKMTLVNPSSGNVAENIVLKVAIYEEHFGWEWTEIAWDEFGTPGEYSKELTHNRLSAGAEKDFWIKVTREEGTWNMKPTYFLLDIKND